METGIWLAEQKIQYATVMLYHNIKNNDNRKAKQVIEEQEQNKFKNTFYQKVQKIAKDLQIGDVTSTSKSKWKKKTKGKARDRIRKRMKEDMQEKTKCQIRNDKCDRKQYVRKCESNMIKDVIKTRLHMWNTKCNCIRNVSDTMSPLQNRRHDRTHNGMPRRK